MIEQAFVVGLAVGYLDWLLVGDEQGHVPIWTPFVDWWIRSTKHSAGGKPFTCELCMAFWLSAVLHFLYVQVFGGQVEFVGVMTSAAVGLWYVVDLRKRYLIVLPR